MQIMLDGALVKGGRGLVYLPLSDSRSQCCRGDCSDICLNAVELLPSWLSAVHDAGKWFDLLIEDTSVSPVTASQHNNSISYASQYIPLWVGIADVGSAQAAAVTQSFLQSGLIQVGGISTSSFNSSQQWDFPNCWAPIQVGPHHH